MKHFVTGATGFTGRAVVAQLAGIDGEEVVAHVRPDSSRMEHWQGVFTGQGASVDTAAWSVEAMAGALERERPDVLYFLIGTTKKRRRDIVRAGGDAQDGSYLTVDYGFGKILLDACAEIGLAPKFVYVSSMGVNASTPSEYMKARWLLERDIKASGLDFAIARPAFIIGERDEPRLLEHTGGVVADAVFGMMRALGAKKTARRYGSTDNHELARALVRLARDPGQSRVTVENEDLKDDSPAAIAWRANGSAPPPIVPS